MAEAEEDSHNLEDTVVGNHLDIPDKQDSPAALARGAVGAVHNIQAVPAAAVAGNIALALRERPSSGDLLCAPGSSPHTWGTR